MCGSKFLALHRLCELFDETGGDMVERQREDERKRKEKRGKESKSMQVIDTEMCVE